ncbi:MAG: HAD family phosphatase [Deltaproteobacteria bacterium]|nr:HAD family phosphatase [Deltaproteobacteria bacterium]
MPRTRYPLICFDLDGTLVTGLDYVWTTLHRHFRTDSVARQNARQAFREGRLAYADWFHHDVVLLRDVGATRDAIGALFASIRTVPGARETLDALRRGGAKLAVLSGSVDLLLEIALPGERFEHVLINRLGFDADGLIEGGTPTAYDVDRKADGIIELCRREGLATGDAAFVGDNENDVAAARTAGFSVAFDCKSPRLSEVASVVVPGGDLRAILPHLLDGE